MTREELKKVMDYLEAGNEVSCILIAEIAENGQSYMGTDAFGWMDGVCDAIMCSEELEKILLPSVEKEEKPKIVFNAVSGAEELKALKDCNVYHIEDVENKEEGYYATEITFYNENTGKYIGLLKDDDGELSMSQWY